MTNLTIGTVSIFGKEYNKLVVYSITTVTGTSSIVTSIPYLITNSNNNIPNIPNQNGYKDTLVITNPSSVSYNDLVSELLTTLGLTSSNY